MAADDEAALLDELRQNYQTILEGSGHAEAWGVSLMQQHCRLDGATWRPAATTTFAVRVGAGMVNALGILHGGCTATLFDVCTSVTVLAHDLGRGAGAWPGSGVSRYLNVTYLRPARVGDELELRSEVVHAGKKLATVRGELRRTKDGALIASCEHGKFNLNSDAAKV